MGKASRIRAQRSKQRQTIRTQVDAELNTLKRAMNGEPVQGDARLLQIFAQLVERYGVLPDTPTP